MVKYMNIRNIFVSSLVLITIFILPTLLLAEDSITITTYYPSPYGAYNKLQSNKLAVGDTNADSEMTSADQPPANGQIYTARSIILKPQSSLPTTNLVTGEVAYNSSDSSLYLYNGSSWAAVGGGSTCVVTYNSPVGSCSCPTGWTLKLDLGSWGYCYGYGSAYDFSWFRPPGGGYSSGWSCLNYGEGCLCCSS